MSLPLRPVSLRRGRAPSRPSIARASAGPAASRVLAAVALLAAAAALYGVSASPAFALAPGGIEVRGATLTGEASVRRALGLDGDLRPNLFVLDTARLAVALRTLPAVEGERPEAVSVRVALPDRLIVEVRERTPILVWQVGERRLLVDVEGVLLAPLPPGATSALPVLVDQRRDSARLAVGERLDPVDIAVGRLLGAVTPALLGSRAPRLTMRVSDDDGFMLLAGSGRWRAVFGIYTPSLRGPELVDAQVQCLASLLAGGEEAVAVAYLYPEGGRCGTFAPRKVAP